MDDTDRDVLRERLTHLEETVAHQNRVGLIGLLSIVALLSVTWLAGRPSKDLVVDSLELRDSNGTVRSRLGLNPDGAPVFSMYDHKGIKLLTVGQTFQSSSAITLFDEGDPRVQLAAVSKGVSSLRFMDDKNETLSSIYLRPDRGMGISLATADEGLFLGIESGGKPDFRLVDMDEAKKGRIRLVPEEIERFALPRNGQPLKLADPRQSEGKTADAPSDLESADTDATASTNVSSSHATVAARIGEGDRSDPVPANPPGI